MMRVSLLLSLMVVCVVLCGSGCASGDADNPAAEAAIQALDIDDKQAGTKTDTKNGTETATAKPDDPKKSDPKKAAPATALATFGNGCYWCTEAVFQEFDGIHSVVSGFSGGSDPNVTYDDVVRGTTGHAEVVQVKYDPKKISYAELLQAFFLTHDPTTLNRQGADVGTQYRSVVFYHDVEQKRLVETAIKELDASGAWNNPIVTQVVPFKRFIAADKYHQDYFDKNPNDRYCLYNIPSKIRKIRKVFKDKLRPSKQ